MGKFRLGALGVSIRTPLPISEAEFDPDEPAGVARIDTRVTETAATCCNGGLRVRSAPRSISGSDDETDRDLSSRSARSRRALFASLSSRRRLEASDGLGAATRGSSSSAACLRWGSSLSLPRRPAALVEIPWL